MGHQADQEHARAVLSRFRKTERRGEGDQLRKRLPSARKSPTADDAPSQTATIERVPDPAEMELGAVWDQEWEAALLAAAVARIKPHVNLKQWPIFDLHVLKAWPAWKVAKSLGVNIGRVWLAKHRVGVRLKHEIKKLAEATI